MTDWLKLSVIFQKKKNLNISVYSFQTFCLLDPVNQWYTGSNEIVFKVSTNSVNHFLPLH